MRSVKDDVAAAQRNVFLLDGFVSCAAGNVVVCSACYCYAQNMVKADSVHKAEELSAEQRAHLACIEYVLGRALLLLPIGMFALILRTLARLDGGALDGCAAGLSDRMEHLLNQAAAHPDSAPVRSVAALAEGWKRLLKDMGNAKSR